MNPDTAAQALNWRENMKGPLQDTQPHNVSFVNYDGPSKRELALDHSGRTRSQVPGRKTSAYAPSQKFKGLNGRSQASGWNAQRPQVLYNDHSEILLKHEYKHGMIINAPVHKAISSKSKSQGPSHNKSIPLGEAFTQSLASWLWSRYTRRNTRASLFIPTIMRVFATSSIIETNSSLFAMADCMGTLKRNRVIHLLSQQEPVLSLMQLAPPG